MGISLLLTFTIGTALGVWGAMNSGRWYERMTSILMFVLFSLPSFWIATVLVVFLTTPEYGPQFQLFAPIGVGRANEATNFFEIIRDASPHIVLPCLVIVISSIPYLYQMCLRTVVSEMGKPYITASLAKGFQPKKNCVERSFAQCHVSGYFFNGQHPSEIVCRDGRDRSNFQFTRAWLTDLRCFVQQGLAGVICNDLGVHPGWTYNQYPWRFGFLSDGSTGPV